MTNWKYTDDTNTVVYRVNQDGSTESCLVSVIAEWIAAGNNPEPADVPAPGVPQTVTMRQARLALLAAGKLAMVEPAIDALPSPQKEAARIEWEYSAEVHRGKPFVQLLGAAIGLDDAALDGLFTEAALL